MGSCNTQAVCDTDDCLKIDDTAKRKANIISVIKLSEQSIVYVSSLSLKERYNNIPQFISMSKLN